MKAVAFIPARFSSTRLPGKPLKDIKGRTMIERVYERVRKAKTIAEVTVATDDERILRAVLGFGGKAVLTSRDCRTGTERVAEAAKDVRADIVVNVQGDEPLIEPSIIDDCVRAFNDRQTSISTPVVAIKDRAELEDPNVVKVVTDLNGFAMYFSRSPIPHLGSGGFAYKHIGLYAFRKEALLKLVTLPESPLERAEGLEQLRALENGFKIKAVLTTYNPISVDTPEDLERARKTAEA